MLKKLMARWRKWNDWRKFFADCSMLYKLKVLFGLIHSTSFECWSMLNEEEKTR